MQNILFMFAVAPPRCPVPALVPDVSLMNHLQLWSVVESAPWTLLIPLCYRLLINSFILRSKKINQQNVLIINEPSSNLTNAQRYDLSRRTQEGSGFKNRMNNFSVCAGWMVL